MATVIPKGKVWAIATIVTTKEDKLTKIQTRKWFVIVKELTPKQRHSNNDSTHLPKDRRPSRRPHSPTPSEEVHDSQSTTMRGV
jgi:hypothetical protein